MAGMYEITVQAISTLADGSRIWVGQLLTSLVLAILLHR
jgi:hypothetical protein